MTYTEPHNTVTVDVLSTFLESMNITATEFLQTLDDELEEEILELYNDKVEPDNQVDSLLELPDNVVLEELEEYTGGDTWHLFTDYLDQLDETYTMVTTPSGWYNIIQLSSTTEETVHHATT